MRAETIKRIKQRSLLLAGVVVLVNAIIATLWANLHAGIWFTYALGLVLVLWGVLLRKLPCAISGMLTIGAAAAAVCVLALFIYGRTDNVTCREDAVIVLGTGVRGTALSQGLQNRLDCAVDYHARNPGAIIVVSGGQGPQEDIPEGVAMERYLLAQGVPQDRIIREAVSSSTAENFRYSKPLLDERFRSGYSVAFVTSDFHIFRAGQIAARTGFSSITHCHAATPWYMIIPNGLRECAAIIKFWLNLQPS